MIKYITQNVLQVQTGIVVHGCNARGVMGAGVAAALSRKYPVIYRDYRKHLASFDIPEQALGTTGFSQIEPELFVANAITQLNYGRDRDFFHYESFHKVVEAVCEKSFITNLPIYCVRIGSGLAGGDWSKIEEIIDYYTPKEQVFNICTTPYNSKYQ